MGRISLQRSEQGEQERRWYMRSTTEFDQGSRLARVVAEGRATTDGSRSKRGRPERRRLQAPGEAEVLARDAGGGKEAGETAKQRKDAEPKRGVGWFCWRFDREGEGCQENQLRSRKASENDDLTLKRVVKVDRGGGDDVGEWMRARISSVR
ncbi:uncharacterized protein AKAW2_30495A [Aspergillus luchuensis]|uniref:Uncharacterized protein n=2 Tax=Aspergillus kawachii TaxID=1069201 RepID=A0A7R7ZXK3_ASPKA|nr:uncharacterized protein AKAW2_30495A [Aspergillus luchuensis]BCR97176.1 hypothetical protein AKAW2_30495A [Aspergillus luchuensis]